MNLTFRIAIVVLGGALVATEQAVDRSGPSFPGSFIHPTAIRGEAAAHDCLSLGENMFDTDVREVGVCHAQEIHRVGRAASRDWWYGTYVRRWLLDAADTVNEVEVVLFRSPVSRASTPSSTLEAIWHYRYEANMLRSVTPEVVAARQTGVLIAIDECVNGTGGCSQSFAIYDRGKASPLALPFLDSLNRRVPNGVRHGFHVDVRTLRGSAGLYSANDANCCPSMSGEFVLRLRGNALGLTSLEVRPLK